MPGSLILMLLFSSISLNLQLSIAARLTSQSSGTVLTGTRHHAQLLQGIQSHLLMLVGKHSAELQHGPEAPDLDVCPHTGTTLRLQSFSEVGPDW